jgi:DNA-binding GntR family transcriptional regulator
VRAQSLHRDRTRSSVPWSSLPCVTRKAALLTAPPPHGYNIMTVRATRDPLKRTPMDAATPIPLVRGAVPLHRQLSDILRAAIVSGEWRVGDTLPTERTLATSHSVSRITVRHALADLESEGLVGRKRPTGNVVASNRPRSDNAWSFESLQDVVAFGEKTRVQILSYTKQQPPEDVAHLFGVPATTKLPCVHGVRSLEGVPLGEFYFWLTSSVGSQLSRHDLSHATLFSVIENRVGIRLVEAQQTVWCEPAGRRLARLLRMRPTAPVLAIRRVYLSDHRLPVEIAVSRFHGTRYQLHHVLKRLSTVPAGRV